MRGLLAVLIAACACSGGANESSLADTTPVVCRGFPCTPPKKAIPIRVFPGDSCGCFVPCVRDEDCASGEICGGMSAELDGIADHDVVGGCVVGKHGEAAALRAKMRETIELEKARRQREQTTEGNPKEPRDRNRQGE